MIRDNKVITPTFTDAVLESITRDTVIALAKSLGYEVVERTIDRTELYTADEAFLCGSAMELTPVLGIDKYGIGEGEITKQLHKAYVDAARGMNEQFKNWVTPIY